MTRVRRVLWVPNEIGDALQSGFRRAFADLLRLALADPAAREAGIVEAVDERRLGRELAAELIDRGAAALVAASR